MQYTPNLNLPIFESGDAVDLLTSYNVAMQALDTAVAGKGSAADVATALSNSSTAMSTATQAASDAADAAADAEQAAADAAAVASVAQAADTKATTAQAVATRAASDATTAVTIANTVTAKLVKTATSVTVDDLSDAIVTQGGYIAVPDPIQP